MKYVEIEELSISEFNERAQHFDSGIELSHLLLGLAAGPDNWKEVQDIFIDYLSHSDVGIIGTAMLALSHLGRLSGRLERELVIKKLLETVEKHPSLAGRLEDVLDDFSVMPLLND